MPGVPEPRLRRLMLLVAAVAVVAAALGIGVRALEGAHVAVDEEQYVLSATSLVEDGDLDITDELRDQRWRAFADVAPHVETSVLPDGTQISPHDPLLPLLLAVPTGIAGWVGAKVALSLLAGLLAALLLWLAVRRFGVGARTAAVGVSIAAASMPLAVYGQQLYPELPAALLVLVAVAALTAPSNRTLDPSCGPQPRADDVKGPRCGRVRCGRVRRRELVALGAVVTALPWLSVKYAGVALVLAVLGARRGWRAGMRAEIAVLGGVLAVMGAVYLVVHRIVWGGWTAYASGDHFAQTGEFAVVGIDPDHAERALRIAGLLLDREFGLVPWQPAWLLLVPAVAGMLALRLPGRGVLLWPLAAGWFVATFVALTMHGYWSPGRQVVVVLPLGVLAVLVWLERTGRGARRVALGLGLAGVLGYGVFLVEGYGRRTTWVVHFVDAHAPAYRLLAPVLTDWRGDLRWAHVAGIAVLAALAWWGVRAAGVTRGRTGERDEVLSGPTSRSTGGDP
ncbi:MAG: hypothetical protein ACT4RN_15290 [Pseudonocardia sp.]